MPKPREKLKVHGLNQLSNADLIAIILNQGTKNEDVFTLSRRLINDYGPKPLAFEKQVSVMQQKYQINFVHACKLLACFELGRRTLLNEQGKFIRCAHDVFVHLAELQHLKKEQMRGLYFDNRNRLLHDESIAVGNLTTNIIHPREVFRPAIEHSAAAVIVVHNHPSGNPEPSEEDIKVTRELIKAAEIMKIAFLDHVIIGRNKFFSMKERGVV